MNYERTLVRFSVTFASNIIGAGLSFLAGILVARGLGVAPYGDLNFILATLASIMALLDMGTSSAFYTFLSQRSRGLRLIGFYASWIALQGLIVMAFIALAPAHWIAGIWLHIDRTTLLIAFGSSFIMGQLWQMVVHVGESERKTVALQLASLAQAIIHLILVGLFYATHRISIRCLLWLWLLEYGSMIVILMSLWSRKARADAGKDESLQELLKEFTTYSKPLAVYGLMAFLYQFVDRWMLQRFGGSVQQGFYSIGGQFANISMLATASVLKVFWKEIAEAQAGGNLGRVRHLYMKVIHALYFVPAMLSCFLIPFSRDILLTLVGSAYAGGALCLMLMFTDSLHRSLGQIQGSFLCATSDTKTYLLVEFILIAISLPATYWLLAPPTATIPGLGAGASSLIAKMVILQIFAVNLQAYLIAKHNGWPYQFAFQLIIPAILLPLGFASRWIAISVLHAFSLPNYLILSGIIAGCLYLSLVIPAIRARPELFGSSRHELEELTQMVLKRLNRPSAS